MSDAYDRAISYLFRGNPTPEELNTLINKEWEGALNPLFRFLGPDRDARSSQSNLGCPTMVKLNSYYHAWTPELTAKVLADPRIPYNATKFTPETLPDLAAFWREVDKLMDWTPPEHPQIIEEMKRKYGDRFIEMTELGPRIRCRPGELYKKILPHSEVCMHFQKAGEMMYFVLDVHKAISCGKEYWSCSVQLFRDDGSTKFSGPITTGETGLFHEYVSEEEIKSWGDGIGPEPKFYFYPESTGG